VCPFMPHPLSLVLHLDWLGVFPLYPAFGRFFLHAHPRETRVRPSSRLPQIAIFRDEHFHQWQLALRVVVAMIFALRGGLFELRIYTAATSPSGFYAFIRIAYLGSLPRRTPRSLLRLGAPGLGTASHYMEIRRVFICASLARRFNH
jgi:hypothetical protein